MREVGEHTPNNAKFTAVLFGYCDEACRLRAFELRPIIEPNRIEISVVEHDLYADGTVIIVGTSVDHYRERIRRLREGAEHQIIIDDAPTRALQALISDKIDGRVGGTIQQAWAAPHFGFVPVANVVPILPHPAEGPNIAFNVLGFDSSTDFNVGPYHLGILARM